MIVHYRREVVDLANNTLSHVNVANLNLNLFKYIGYRKIID